MKLQTVSMATISLIILTGVWPSVLAEESIAANEYIPVSLTSPPGTAGNYSFDLANLSSIPRANEGYEEALSLLEIERSGIYVGAFREESLFRYDYEPPAPIPPYAGEIEAGYMPTIYDQYAALEVGLGFAKMYASVAMRITLDSSVIAEGVSRSIVRVPVPYSGIIPHPPVEGGSPAFLQITRILDGASYIVISGIPHITDGSTYANTVTVGDRQYMDVTAPLFADIEYEFRYFWCLQGLEYDNTTIPDVIAPMVYYTAEDVMASGQGSTIDIGFAYYNTTTGCFEMTNQTSYGGISLEIPLDLGWSLMAIEGMGGGMWGQEVHTDTETVYKFHVTVEVSDINSYVSLYLPFICNKEVELKSLEIYDNNPAIWVHPGTGLPCAGNYQYYWSATEDCDGDGYTDHPYLNFTDYIIITSRTKIEPCTSGYESQWIVKIVFNGSYDITFPCSEGNDRLRGGGTAHTVGDLPPGITQQWDTERDGTYRTYDSAPMVYLHLTNQSYTFYNITADTYSYPHFSRYFIGIHYGDYAVFYLETTEAIALDAAENPIYIWIGGPYEGDPSGPVMTDIYKSLSTSVLQSIGALAGYIWDGITWVGSEMQQLGEWLWSGILTLYDGILMLIEAVINVLSYVIEFAIIAVSLLVFFGAIVLWNKILLILRNALMKATESLEGALQ